MSNPSKSRIRYFLVCVTASALGSASLTSAADPPSFTIDLPAGSACTFELRIDGSGGNQVYREFLDKNNNIVRTLTAGTGSALTFTNVGTWVTTGHNVLILFPTDTPAGPSTTLYVGRVVFTVDASFNFALQQNNGQATDICATLSP